jgi:predicted acetyltransferase
MDVDLSKCRIRTPTGDKLLPLYQMLMEIFPTDRPVFAEIIEKGRRFYTWTPYALYRSDELLGNVSLMPVRIWMAGRPVKVVGIASVATRKQYRRKGVARRLLQHVLNVVDQQRAPAVLLTGLPAVYQGLGFETIGQTYLAASTERVSFPGRGLDSEILGHLDPGHLEQLAEIYAGPYPNYDGKVVRDPDYWQLYQMLFDLQPRWKILSCVRHGRMVGYARVEVEDDRLLVSELCCQASAGGVAEGLLHFVADRARQAERPRISFALPPGHFAGEVLRRGNVPLEPEPAGAPREAFMVRPPLGEPLGRFARLQWSLADKF